VQWVFEDYEVFFVNAFDTNIAKKLSRANNRQQPFADEAGEWELGGRRTVRSDRWESV